MQNVLLLLYIIYLYLKQLKVEIKSWIDRW